MRMMLRTHLDREAGNIAMSNGTIAEVFGKVFTLIRPEATWFLTEGGQRTVYAVFDMTNPDLIPQIAEPLFQALGGTVEFLPVMSQDDLMRGAAAWAAAG